MAFWINAKRVARYGLVGFIRNGFVSLAAIVIMTITLFVVAGLLITGAALSNVLGTLTSEVDVTVYFTPTATADQISQIQQQLNALPQVASTTLISADEALALFQARHADDQLTMQALQELGDNPLGAELEVQAKDPSQYASIATYLQSEQSSGAGQAIDQVNYQQNETAIERLSTIINTSHRLGFAIAIILAIASVLITFNTIRLAIYTTRDEIGVMNLVGASHWFVRGPFLIAGVLYGLLSGLIVLVALYPITLSLGPGSQNFFGTFNVFSYYLDNFALLFGIVLVSGVALGVLSSFLAVRRYLKM